MPYAARTEVTATAAELAGEAKIPLLRQFISRRAAGSE